MQAFGVLSEAVESHFPSGVPFDARVKFIDVCCIVPDSPFDTQNIDCLVFLLGLFLLGSPWLDGDGLEAVEVSLPLSQASLVRVS